MSRMFEQLSNWWKTEATRHFLWVPVCFSAGIAAYYAWPTEPPSYVFWALSAMLLVAVAVLRKLAWVLLFALMLVTLGAAYAQWHTHKITPTMLREALTPRPVIGVVRDIERTERGVRLTLEHVTVDDLAPLLTPKRVRLSVKFRKDAAFELPRIGDAIAIRAGLMPPMGPALPGGFDFARYFYFRDIGAVGYGLPPWKTFPLPHRGREGVGVSYGEVLPNSAPLPTSPRWGEELWNWRARLTDRIVKTLGPQTGGIAAGLITGDARAISEADFDALRASNLYHIIAISGEHMVIISGVIFISLRLLLLLLPKRFALRPQGKSVAALVTLVLVTLYLFVTGLPVSAVRAYVMIVLVLLAVLLRRHVDPMRSLAIAALLMLLYDPATLLDPGFQLSFAATLAIIALVEARVLSKPPAIERGRVQKLLHGLGTVLLISVVAETATAPLAITMFNNASLYGVLANSLATPLVSLFLMPTVALFFILLPLGLEGVALTLLDYGIRALLGLAYWVSNLPHAQFFVPSLPAWGLALFVVGLLWVCLWQSRVRVYGFVAVVAGVASVLTITSPDMLVGGGMKQIAFRTPDSFVLARGRANSMVPEMWANGLGYKQLAKAEPPHWRCDRLGCVAQVKGKKVAFPFDLAAVGEDCARSDLIISTRGPITCERGAAVLDPSRFKGSNVLALWVNEDGSIRTESSRDWQGARPWSVQVEAGEED